MTNNRVLVPMCKKCLDYYEMEHPSCQIVSETCACCGNQYVTVCMVTGEMIDRHNNE